MAQHIPENILDMLNLADPSWRPVLLTGLEAVVQRNPGYLNELNQSAYLPTEGRLFAAFALPMKAVRYVLVGEGPYPRPESATGFCFMDGAVQSLWSEAGLSKQVNRATSLRNFMKMLLVADGQLTLGNTSGEAMAPIALQARAIGSTYIQTLADLQKKLTENGFLLLNAALVFRPDVPPVKDAKAWLPFLEVVLTALADARKGDEPTLILWGKIAEQFHALPISQSFPKLVSEHPYNLTFIGHQGMQTLFGSMNLLHR